MSYCTECWRERPVHTRAPLKPQCQVKPPRLHGAEMARGHVCPAKSSVRMWTESLAVLDDREVRSEQRVPGSCRSPSSEVDAGMMRRVLYGKVRCGSAWTAACPSGGSPESPAFARSPIGSGGTYSWPFPSGIRTALGTGTAGRSLPGSAQLLAQQRT